MKNAANRILTSAALVAAFALALPVAAAEMRIMSTPVASMALKMVAADFERETGHKVSIDYANIAIARKRVEAGESFLKSSR